MKIIKTNYYYQVLIASVKAEDRKPRLRWADPVRNLILEDKEEKKKNQNKNTNVNYYFHIENFN